MKKAKTLYIVIPCYNEEEVLNETTKRLEKKYNKLIDDKIISKALFVSLIILSAFVINVFPSLEDNF